MTVKPQTTGERRPTGVWAEAIESRRAIPQAVVQPLVRRVAWTYRTGAAWPHPVKADLR
jgi:hypothetical protein